MADDPIIITNRVIYDRLNDHIDKNHEWQTEHQRRDDRIQNGLTIKFYGILAGLVSIGIVIAAGAR